MWFGSVRFQPEQICTVTDSVSEQQRSVCSISNVLFHLHQTILNVIIILFNLKNLKMPLTLLKIPHLDPTIYCTLSVIETFSIELFKIITLSLSSLFGLQMLFPTVGIMLP